VPQVERLEAAEVAAESVVAKRRRTELPEFGSREEPPAVAV